MFHAFILKSVGKKNLAFVETSSVMNCSLQVGEGIASRWSKATMGGQYNNPEAGE